MSDDDQHEDKQADYAQMTSSRPKLRRGVKHQANASDVATIDQSRRALFDLIGEQVGTSRSKTSLGTFDRATGLTTISQMKGNHLHSMGHTLPGGRLVLYPEEAAWLQSRRALIVDDATFEDYCQWMYGGMDGWISYERYQVYTYLKRLGYVVLRAKENHSPPPPAQKKRWMNSLWWHVQRWIRWIAGWVRGFSSTTRPLVRDGQCASYRSVYSALQCIPSIPWHRPSTPWPSTAQKMSVHWDVYKPSTPFKKRDPGPPDFRIVVRSMLDPMPSVDAFQWLFAKSPASPAYQPLHHTRLPNTAPTFLLALVDTFEGVVFLRFAGNGVAPVGYAV